MASARYLDPASPAFNVLLGLVTGLQAIGTTIMIPAVPAMAAAFESGPGIAQFTISGYLIGLACGQIITGAISDRIGRRPVLIAGMLVFTLSGVGCALAQSMELLIALRVVQGFSSAAGMILGRAIIRDALPQHAALRTMNLISMIVGFVPIIGPPVSSLLLGLLSWRAVFVLLAAISALAGVLTWLRIAETLKSPDPHATDVGRIVRNCGEMLARPDSISFVLIGSLLYGGMYSFFALIPWLVTEVFLLPEAQAGFYQGVGSIAGFSGTILASRLLRRWPVRRMLGLAVALAFLSALVVLAICIAGPGGANGLRLLMLPVLAFAFSFGLGHSTYIILSLQPLAHIAGTASALGASVQTVFGGLFALLAAWLYDGTSLALGIGTVFPSLLAALLFFAVARHHTPASVPARA